MTRTVDPLDLDIAKRSYGQPWHGQFLGDGKLHLANGGTKEAPEVILPTFADTYWIDLGMPAVTTPAALAAQGGLLTNTAQFFDGTKRYSPASSMALGGADRTIYRDPAGTNWLIRVAGPTNNNVFSWPDITVTLTRKFGEFGGTVQPINRLLVTETDKYEFYSDHYGAFEPVVIVVYNSPDCSECIINLLEYPESIGPVPPPRAFIPLCVYAARCVFSGSGSLDSATLGDGITATLHVLYRRGFVAPPDDRDDTSTFHSGLKPIWEWTLTGRRAACRELRPDQDGGAQHPAARAGRADHRPA